MPIKDEPGSSRSPVPVDPPLRILPANATLTDLVSPGWDAPPPAAGPAPAQLPAAVAAFVGRDHELARLDDALERAAILAVCGTAGVGKTALAVQWAHQVRDRFPDGQLYVNLRGYDPGRPTVATDALARCLISLGVPDREIPPDQEGRADRYRSETSSRRLLIVLDNASNAEQVRPLLPGDSTCLVLVTSRDSLCGLVALDGAQRVDLDLLPAAEANALLRGLIGTRADDEPEACATLAEQCARLPLALRVAGELAVSRPQVSLADLVEQLRDHRRRLDHLDAGGDPRAAVAAVFSWSIRRLPAATKRVFALLGLHPGPDIDPWATAALAGIAPENAHRALALLARAHLVRSTGGDRYGLHDLLRAYAISLVPAVDDGTDRADAARSALNRLFAFYLNATEAAMDQLEPTDERRPQRRPPGRSALPSLPDPQTACRWMNAEKHCLLAVSAYTAANGWPDHALWLSATLFRHLICGKYVDSVSFHSPALAAAVRVDDRAGQARVLSDLGAAQMTAGRPMTHHVQAELNALGPTPGRSLPLPSGCTSQAAG